MRQMKYLVAVALFLCIRPAFADMFNIQLSNNSGRFTYSTEVFGGQYGPLDLETGLFFNQSGDKMVHLGMMIRNDTLNNPVVISIGTRAYYGDVGHANGQIRAKFAAIAIGGELLFIPDNLGGVGLGVYYYTAPSVVTYMDANGFSEYGVRVNYEITKQSSVSVGYQKINLDLNGGASETVDSSAFFGIGLRF